MFTALMQERFHLPPSLLVFIIICVISLKISPHSQLSVTAGFKIYNWVLSSVPWQWYSDPTLWRKLKTVLALFCSLNMQRWM